MTDKNGADPASLNGHGSGEKKPQGRGEPKTSPRRLTAQQKAIEATELRIQGKTWEQIAADLGYRSPSGAFQAVDRMISRVESEKVETVRAIEGRRLDQLQYAIFEKAAGGSLPHIDRILRIMERRSKLLGLDSPIRLDINLEAELREAGLDPNAVERALAEFFISIFANSRDLADGGAIFGLPELETGGGDP